MRSFQKRENIGEQLRKIMVEQNFHELLDTQFSWGSEFKDIWKDVPPLNQLEEKAEGFVDYLREKKHELFGGTYPPIKQMPNVDLSVIEIDRDGYVSAAGNAVLSPHYSEGKVLIPDENFSTVGNLDWTAWDEDEWAAEGGKGTKSLTPGNSSSGETFMLPFPGSMLKLMVGFGILQLVDQGKTALDELYSYQPTGGNSVCKGSSSRPVRDYFDPMITSSDNYSTCALIKMLHDRGAVDKMNSDFEKWGLK